MNKKSFYSGGVEPAYTNTTEYIIVEVYALSIRPEVRKI